jgi:hypothetical protein
LGVQLKPVTAYHPQANGMAEAKVKALKSILRALVRKRPSAWEDLLPLAVFIYNTSFNELTCHTPFYVCNGREANLPGRIPMAIMNAVRADEKAVSSTRYCAELHENIVFCHEMIANALKQSQHKYPAILDVPDCFNVGQEVYLFNPVLHINEPRAFKQYWTGPFQIIQRINPMVYKIALPNQIDLPEKHQIVHASRLKLKF